MPDQPEFFKGDDWDDLRVRILACMKEAWDDGFEAGEEYGKNVYDLSSELSEPPSNPFRE